MPTQKDRICTYVPENLRKCFKIISAVNGLTESKMLEKLVIECVSENSELLQKLNIESYVLHKNITRIGSLFRTDAGLFDFSVRLPSSVTLSSVVVPEERVTCPRPTLCGPADF